MELRDYLQVFRRNWMLFILLPVLLAGAAFGYSSRQPKMYASEATVLLKPNDPTERLGTANVASATELVNSGRIIKSQAKLIDGPAVARSAAAAMGGGITGPEIRSAIGVSSSNDANIMVIRATTREPKRSADIANAVGEAYIANRRESAVKGLERAIAELDGSIAALEKKIEETGSRPQGAARDALLNSTQTQFRSLSERRQALQIDSALKRGEAEIVSEATPSKSPVSPRPKRMALIGLLAGVVLAAAGALLRDRLDIRLRSREEAEDLVKLPTLAEVPVDRRMSRDAQHIAAIANPDGVTAEAVHSLRVSLRFLSIDDPLRVVLVTSAMPADGKSTVAANLAASYARSGVRTLLVSADLRRPRVDTMFSSLPSTGLVELLTGLAEAAERRQHRHSAPSRSTKAVARAEQSGELVTRAERSLQTAARSERSSDAVARAERSPEVVAAVPGPPSRRRRGAEANGAASAVIDRQRIVDEPVAEPAEVREVPQRDVYVDIESYAHRLQDNMWVLAAGEAVANPLEILGSPVTRQFFAMAREQFDMVIVDSPPVLPVSDSTVLSPVVDGVVFVASMRKTNYKHLLRGVQRLQSTQARVLGIVLNRVPKERANNYYGKAY